MPWPAEAAAAPPPLAGIPGAWDCHVHVFGDPARYPLASARRYTPARVAPDDARAHARRIGAERLLLVQASIYGPDNACVLDALAALGPRCRAVVSPPASPLDAALIRRWGEAGVRGVRVNPFGRITDVDVVADAIAAAARALDGTGWHLEVNCDAAAAGPIADLVAGRDVPVVFDHLMGLDLDAADLPRQLDAAADVAARDRVWTKLSGVTRGADHPARREAQAAAWRRFLAAAPDRVIWGSDWPHTPIETGAAGLRTVDDAGEAATALRLAGDAATRIFRTNPDRLLD